MHGWTDEWMDNRRMDGCMMTGWMDGCIDIKETMDGSMDGRIDGCMHALLGWTLEDGWVHE